MPKGDVDRLFEDMFGFKDPASPPPPPSPAPPETPAVTPKKAPSAPVTKPEDLARAAQAVRDAVKAHTGRRPSVEGWRPVAAEALGMKRLVQVRWDAVLAKGTEMGLFCVDSESLSYPVIEVLEPKPEPVPVPDEEPEVPKPQSRETPPTEADPEEEYIPPTVSNPPFYRDCGHMSWWSEKDAEGKEHCTGCKKKMPVSWQDLKGEFVRPLPVAIRRSIEREGLPGFPGYCCDDEGFYIGGFTNNCTWKNPDKTKWCSYHRGIGRHR